MAKKKYRGLVIVESPAKAKKINAFLGSDYVVMASMGHVRDLPENASEIPEEIKKLKWPIPGVNIDDDFRPLYVVPREKKKLVTELKARLKESEELILATDEDREGESIGWHLAQLLEPTVPVKRMVFSEITKEAIREAIRNTRTVDSNLVAAQEARRVIDRLYGYRLSPLLWRKVRPKLSAGRVQSVAVRLLVKRELERRAFRKGTYWDLKAKLTTGKLAGFEADVVTVGGKRVAAGKDFDENTGRLKADADVLLLSEAEARALVERLSVAKPPAWSIRSIETRDQARRPSPPFTTSTLQQEANRKLGMSARETMQTAQRLYEDGLITYMRTDSVTLSNEAIGASRRTISERYGADYLPDAPRTYANKVKNAQEAHEAIRPAGTEMKTGEELNLDGRELKLYSLIWKRTVASQMSDARLKFQTVTIEAENAEFRATGRHIEFPGFFRAYVEGVDDPEAALDDTEAALPPMSEGEQLALNELTPLGHETQPPARFTEATLIRELEANGIGRPSTYASIISTILDRGYSSKAGNALLPTFTGMAVTKLLENHFPNLVDTTFTAKMEQTLDDIANGEASTVPYLREFYSGEKGLDTQVKEKEESIDPREACTLDLDGLVAKVRVGKFGPYLVKDQAEGAQLTASLPEDSRPADLTNEEADKLLALKAQGPQSLGSHPEHGQPIYVLLGPFGPYVQLGDVAEDGTKPKRVSIPKGTPMEAVTLEQAIDLLRLPRTLGAHPETTKTVTAGIGRFGPYVLHDGVYKSLPKDEDVLKVGLDRAVELLKMARTRGGATPRKELGAHPVDGEPVQIFDGRYGAYVKHGKINATIPKDQSVDELTLEQAVALILERAGSAPAKKAAKKSAARKTTGKKSAAKKSSAKKSAAKKAAKPEPSDEEES
jgi:DNA topoisomerase-1